jgi:pyrroline-5-carboxylate reductase
MENPRIALVGSGVMAEVLINALLGEGFLPPERIWASGPRSERAEQLRASYGIHATTDNQEAIGNADLVVVAVKPQTLATFLPQIRPALRREQIVVSIVVGVRIAVFVRALGHAAIVRCIPNTPSQIRRGVTVWTATPEVPAAARETVRGILQTLGREYYVEDEADIDRASAVHGIGPAVLARFVQDYEAAAEGIGAPRELARESLLETIAGTVEMMLRSGKPAAEVIREVASPGGVTAKALEVMEKGGFQAAIADAVETAYRRTLDLRDRIDKEVP